MKYCSSKFICFPLFVLFLIRRGGGGVKIWQMLHGARGRYRRIFKTSSVYVRVTALWQLLIHVKLSRHCPYKDRVINKIPISFFIHDLFICKLIYSKEKFLYTCMYFKFIYVELFLLKKIYLALIWPWLSSRLHSLLTQCIICNIVFLVIKKYKPSTI